MAERSAWNWRLRWYVLEQTKVAGFIVGHADLAFFGACDSGVSASPHQGTQVFALAEVTDEDDI
jgi:hypothetical protein